MFLADILEGRVQNLKKCFKHDLKTVLAVLLHQLEFTSVRQNEPPTYKDIFSAHPLLHEKFEILFSTTPKKNQKKKKNLGLLSCSSLCTAL